MMYVSPLLLAIAFPSFHPKLSSLINAATPKQETEQILPSKFPGSAGTLS